MKQIHSLSFLLVWLLPVAVWANNPNPSLTFHPKELKPTDEKMGSWPLSSLDQDSLSDLNDQIKGKLGSGRVLKAVIIAQGSTGDVLPLVAFGRHLNEKLPWLNVSRVASIASNKLDNVIQDQGMESCPLLNELSFFQSIDIAMASQKNPRKELAKMFLPGQGMFGRKLALDQMPLKDVGKVLDGMDLVFIWTPQVAICGKRLYSFLAKIKALDRRMVFHLSPTHEDTVYFNLWSLVKLLRGGTEHPSDAHSNHQACGLTCSETPMPPKGQMGFSDEVEQELKKSVRGRRLEEKEFSSFPHIVLWSRVFALEKPYAPEFVKFAGTYQLPESEDFQPPEKLKEWLDSRERSSIVYIGLGSLSSAASKDTNAKICAAMEQLPQYNFIWQIGRGNIEKDIPQGLSPKRKCLQQALVLNEYVPHTWLFPRVQTVVHHGGSGTTHAVLLGGAASVILPQLVNDQIYFSMVVNYLNVGVGLQKKFTAKQLKSAIFKASENERVRNNVREKQADMLKEQNESIGAKLVAEYTLKNLPTLLKGLKGSFRSKEKKCLHFRKQFRLKKSDEKYCVVKGWLSQTIICHATREQATKFFLEPVSKQIHPASKAEVPVEVSAILGYRGFAGRKRYLNGKRSAKGYSAGYTIGYWRSKKSLRIFSALREEEYDYCIREEDTIRMASQINGKFFGLDGNNRWVLHRNSTNLDLAQAQLHLEAV